MHRYVKYYKYKKEKNEAGSYWAKKYQGMAVFHEFGIDYEELDNCIRSFSTAILELPDGSIKNLPVELIAFCTPITE
ncbi:MAG: hypothetical protein GY865_16120 [candidate division Zixibacteria bacterium]|nr:hypothetical protein [candidate division Zixibacteria bacterium]